MIALGKFDGSERISAGVLLKLPGNPKGGIKKAVPVGKISGRHRNYVQKG